MAGEANGEKAVGVECAWGRIHAGHDRGESTADLGGVDRFRESMTESHLGEMLECAIAVGERAANGGEGSFRADKPLLDGGVAAGAGFHGLAEEGFPALGGFADGVEDVEQHGLDDEAVVVVPMEVGTIAVEAVALVPLLVLAQGVVNAHGVPGLTVLAEHGLDDGGEEEPVVEAGLDEAGFDQGADEVVFCGGVEPGPELVGGADDGQREEGGVDDGLAVIAEVETRQGILGRNRT